MGCKQYQEDLIALAFAALDPKRERELRAHLVACAACRQQLEMQRSLAVTIDRGVAQSVSQEPSPDFAARIRQRIAAEPAPRSAWWNSLRPAWLPVAAGALAVLALAFWFVQRQAEPGPQQGPAPLDIARTHAPLSPAQETSPANAQVAAVHPYVPGTDAAGPKRISPARSGIVPLRRSEPEVIVPPGQREAILQFYAVLRSGRADAASLMASAAPLEILDITIQPLEVKPLPGNAAEGPTDGTGR